MIFNLIHLFYGWWGVQDNAILQEPSQIKIQFSKWNWVWSYVTSLIDVLNIKKNNEPPDLHCIFISALRREQTKFSANTAVKYIIYRHNISIKLHRSFLTLFTNQTSRFDSLLINILCQRNKGMLIDGQFLL